MSPERIIPDETHAGIVALHLKRYDFSVRFLVGKKVLDVACGVGYGAHHLASSAHYVLGMDIDNDAIAYAQMRYSRPQGLQFVRGDVTQTGLADSQFDVVCSFETIEHLNDVDAFLMEMKRVLVSDGVFIVSTPCVVRSTSNPKNPFHVQEWSPEDFEHLLSMYFKNVELFGQFRRQTIMSAILKRLDVFNLRARLLPTRLTENVAHFAGVRATPELQLDDLQIRPGTLRDASEIVAVAHN